MQIAHGHSGEVLQSTTCDRCGVEVGPFGQPRSRFAGALLTLRQPLAGS